MANWEVLEVQLILRSYNTPAEVPPPCSCLPTISQSHADNILDHGLCAPDPERL
jgi:hypothetical protein